ncbi:MAG: phosphatase PAP2 family protein [bacterium]
MNTRTEQKRSAGFFQEIIRVISPTEMVTFVFIILMLILTTFFHAFVDVPGILINSFILLSATVIINYLRAKSDSKFIRAIHVFYVLLVVILVFKTVEKLSFAIHGRDYDQWLITIDHFLLGGINPTVWLYQHVPVMPFFVEFLQICYVMYYLLPVILAVEFFMRRKREHRIDHNTDELEVLRFTIVYGLLLSYLGYFALPGIGPRFTLHTFWNISSELPGILLTEPLRWLINLGENIQAGMSNFEAARVVTRDVFPSGHTEITLLSIFLGFKFRARTRWVVLFIGSGLIFSTVYLRYHYFIDVIAGTLVALLAFYSAIPVIHYLLRLKKRILC